MRYLQFIVEVIRYLLGMSFRYPGWAAILVSRFVLGESVDSIHRRALRAAITGE